MDMFMSKKIACGDASLEPTAADDVLEGDSIPIGEKVAS
jgi:hypothetical protein